LICDSLSAWQIWGHEMGRSHPMALRERVVAFVEEGHSHRAAGARFRVSVKFVNDMVILKRKTGGLEPRAQGNGGGHGKLASLRGWIEARMVAKPDLTLDDLVLGLADRHSITIHRVSVWRVLRSLGLTHKKRHPSRGTEAA
jgi:transposase